MKKFALLLALSCFWFSGGFSQKDFYKNYQFTKADTLRGMLRPERTVYDVTFYDLNLKIEPDRHFVSGYVDIYFKAVKSFKTLQIDLFENMHISKIEHKGGEMRFDRLHAAVFVDLLPGYNQGESGRFRIYYEGYPTTAQNPPWDGGFVWKKDSAGKDWIGVACEGTGASLWWPNKDHLSDEPDSMAINISVPDGLMCVSNGNLRATTPESGGFTNWHWFVSYPINNYNVSVNIADYAHFSDVWVASDGDSLACDYYVLKENLEIAKIQFAQVQGMFDCYEKYFGKYPFWRDGFAMVETPYLGMEHQSGIAYGNQYKRGYLGGRIPKDMSWDYIIIHETGHEWWGNSISSRDHAEMWIHEAFTTYMEALYVECTMSYADAMRYLRSQRPFIVNAEPMLGAFDVNFDRWRSSDNYYKGTWFLNTLRHAVGDDVLWFDILKSFYEKHAYQNIVTADFLNYMNDKTGRDWSRVFEQYLTYPKIPVLLYKLEEKNGGVILKYKWQADVAGFDMPALAGNAEAYERIFPTEKWQEKRFENVKKEAFKIGSDVMLIEAMLRAED